MTDLEMRSAQRNDLPFIVGLIHNDAVAGQSFETPDSALDAPYLSAFAAIAADPNQMLIVAWHDQTPVGTFQLSFSPGIVRQGAWRCTIEGVHVAPQFRNRGVGGAMMNWAVETARSRQCWVVQLTSNAARTDARRFYERLGFAPSHTGFKLIL